MVDGLDSKDTDKSDMTLRVGRDGHSTADAALAQLTPRCTRRDAVRSFIEPDDNAPKKMVATGTPTQCQRGEVPVANVSAAPTDTSNVILNIAARQDGVTLEGKGAGDDFARGLQEFASRCGGGQLVCVLSAAKVEAEWSQAHSQGTASTGAAAQNRRDCLKRRRICSGADEPSPAKEPRSARAVQASGSHHACLNRKRGRCCKSHCNRKLASFALYASQYMCKCGLHFCYAHRGAMEHSCTYDWKSEGRRTARSATSSAVPDKLLERL
jgi:hypothetical protein